MFTNSIWALLPPVIAILLGVGYQPRLSTQSFKPK